jgi:hypothetical protein
MRISEALGERNPLKVHFAGGSVLNIVYAPATYTIAELEELQNAERDINRVVESIRRLVLEWDLQDEDGVPISLQPVPKAITRVTDPENGEVTVIEPPEDPLRTKVPTNIFMTIIRAVNEDQNPGESPRP